MKEEASNVLALPPPSWDTVMGITEGDLTVSPKEARGYNILSCEHLTTQFKTPKGLLHFPVLLLIELNLSSTDEALETLGTSNRKQNI